jgi:hypothetical protein
MWPCTHRRSSADHARSWLRWNIDKHVAWIMRRSLHHLTCVKRTRVMLHAVVMISCGCQDVMQAAWFHASIMIHANIMISCEHHHFMRASWFHSSIMNQAHVMIPGPVIFCCKQHQSWCNILCAHVMIVKYRKHGPLRMHEPLRAACACHDCMGASWIMHFQWAVSLCSISCFHVPLLIFHDFCILQALSSSSQAVH